MSILGSTCRGYSASSGHVWHSLTSSTFQPSHNHAHTKPQANHNGTRQLTKCKSYLTGTSTHQLGLHRSMCACTCKINACFAMPVRFTDYLFLQKTNPHIGEEPSFFRHCLFTSLEPDSCWKPGHFHSYYCFSVMIFFFLTLQAAAWPPHA